MLTGSSNYNRRQVHSKQNPKISLPRNKTRSLEKMQSYPQQLLSETPLDSKNVAQSFYRTTATLAKNKKIVKLGWRVIQLTIDQVDLAIYCLSMLQSKIVFPMKFYSKTEQNKQYAGNDIYQDVWVEWQILQDRSKLETRGYQLAVYKFCLSQLIPRIRDFINQNITWTCMCSPNYEDRKVISKFDRQVILPLAIKLKDFRAVTIVK